MSNALTTLTSRLASRFDMGEDGSSLIDTLKATAFKGDVTDAQMTALLVVANQYGLNPWTKEIYAFPDKKNGIVPVVGVDGWARIINENDHFDGMEFNQSDEMVKMPEAKSAAPAWIECVMYRNDRSRPVIIREYLDETYREPFKGQYGVQIGPWQTHPKRFLRHKAMIQCARMAFGFGGIYDQDEADRIVEKDMGPAEVISTRMQTKPEPQKQAELPAYSDEDIEKNLPLWTGAMQSGRTTPDRVISTISTKYTLSEAQRQRIHKAANPEPEVIDADPETGEIMPSEHDDFLADMDKAE